MEIRCNTCVDTKPRDIEINCIISGDIGGHRVSSYCKQQKVLRWQTNEAKVILCVHIYEHTRQCSLNTCRDLEDTCYGAFTRVKILMQEIGG